MIEAVIFDMDGLLVDSEPVWFLARKDLLHGHGKVWTEADQFAMAGVHTQVWVDAVGERLEGRLSPEQVLDEILDRMERFYVNGEVAVLTGADEALEVCAGRYRVGLASGSPRRLIDAALHGAGWEMHFEDLISGDELEHGKPEPDIYLEIMQRMELDAVSTAVVEDSGAGIRAGKAAGTKVIAVPNPHTTPSPGVLAMADACIDSLYYLPRALGGLSAKVERPDPLV
jgi:HAD superfamily hydrolase (TIGR01509 family)